MRLSRTQRAPSVFVRRRSALEHFNVPELFLDRRGAPKASSFLCAGAGTLEHVRFPDLFLEPYLDPRSPPRALFFVRRRGALEHFHVPEHPVQESSEADSQEPQTLAFVHASRCFCSVLDEVLKV